MTALKNALRKTERRLRAGFRKLLGQVLTSGSVTRSIAPAHLDPTSIRRVLVVRMNSRLGNTLAMTTLLTALHDTMPGASIDVLTTYADAGDLLHGIPGLGKVMVLSNRGWRRPGESLKVLRAYRATQYDLAIDPVPFSLGGRIALRLCRARWRLGFGGEAQWLHLDFAAELPSGLRHQVLRPLALLQQAFGYEVEPGKPRMRVANSDREIERGAELLSDRLGQAARQPVGGSTVIGFFASARGQKNLGMQWWRDFWQAYLEVRPDTAPLEVLPNASHPPVNGEFATVHCPSPRMLAATISHVSGFFSADTGPMHLASAAGVPTIAFFNWTHPATFGPIGPKDVAMIVNGMTPQEVARECADIVSRRFVAAT
ncbi:MAG: glycosyltransferase family 9 protein [Steroidobacteraceae bacterium]